MTMFVDVRKHVVTKRENPFINTNTALAGEGFALSRPQRCSQGIKSVQQQILLIVKVRIECCSAHISAINDVLNRQGFEALLLDQCKERSPEKLLGPLYTPVLLLRHPTSLASEQLGMIRAFMEQRSS